MAKLTRYKFLELIAMLICILVLPDVDAQNNYRLAIRSVDKDSAFISNALQLRTLFQDRLQCEDYITRLPVTLQAKGYLSSSVDSTITGENQTQIALFVGERYAAIKLRIRKVDERFLQLTRTNGLLLPGSSIQFSDYRLISDKLLDYFEENGYPFAKVSLDSITLKEEGINAVLNIDQGFPYHIDSIRTFGAAKISGNFLHRYLGVERGSLYNKNRLAKIDQRLLELPYLQQTQPWDLTMLNTGSIVNLYLQQKKSNQINILAGFLPANQQLGGKLLLTVDANLQLKNAFGGGETFGLVWQQIQQGSPKLHLQFTQPYLFNSPFSTDFLFELNKRDSSFLNINGQLGLLYRLSPDETAKVVIQTQQTNVLQIDTMQVKASKRLPDLADVGSINLGINYELSKTDYRFNPRKGNELSVMLSAGNKTIRKNNVVTQIKDTAFDYGRLYDSVKLKTYQLRLSLKAAHYFRIGSQSVLKTAVDAGAYQSPNFFRNELFQIGGYRLLRGFDEESIYANRYAVGTLEYRYLLGLNANFFVFADFGKSGNSIVKQTNNYLGVGTGLSFETKSGIFNISYALGKRDEIGFNIKQSKIHLGYVSIF